MRNLNHIAASIGILVCVGFLFADSRVQPPAKSSVIGAWVGFDQDRLFFCRLELSAKDTGLFATTFVNNPARLYAVSAWKLDGFKLEISLDPIDKEAEPIFLKGDVEHPQLTLEFGGKNGEWKRKLVLFDEREFRTRNERLMRRIEVHKGGK